MDQSVIFGDQSSSDVVIRLRTDKGRDVRLYCHSSILKEKSTYFAHCLSKDWPVCYSHTCIEMHCQESEFNHHIIVLRLLYNDASTDICDGVLHALSILGVAVSLGCYETITACVNYLSAIPWKESEEEEILRVVPSMGSVANPILDRLQPVSPNGVERLFLSAFTFATTSSLIVLKSSVQEMLEYMVSEDDDAPLLTADNNIKIKVHDCSLQLLSSFECFLLSVLQEHKPKLDGCEIESFHFHLSDLSWIFCILSRLDVMHDFVGCWLGLSGNMVRALERVSGEEALLLSTKAIEVGAGILNAVRSGKVVLPMDKLVYVVKVWLPFVRTVRPLLDAIVSCSDIWKSLELSFVSILLIFPTEDVAEVLTEWLKSEHADYPDLREVFEVWYYRSKDALRRLQNGGLSDC